MATSPCAGLWKIKSSRVQTEDQSWIEDPISGGRVAFSEGGNFCLFFRSVQGGWGYSGTYQVENEKMFVTIDACTAEDVEGHTLERDIKFINNNEFVYLGKEFHTGRTFEAVLSRVD